MYVSVLGVGVYDETAELTCAGRRWYRRLCHA